MPEDYRPFRVAEQHQKADNSKKVLKQMEKEEETTAIQIRNMKIKRMNLADFIGKPYPFDLAQCLQAEPGQVASKSKQQQQLDSHQQQHQDLLAAFERQSEEMAMLKANIAQKNEQIARLEQEKHELSKLLKQ